MMNWLKRIFQVEVSEDRSEHIARSNRRIGINKNYDPLIWQKNRFKEKDLKQS